MSFALRESPVSRSWYAPRIEPPRARKCIAKVRGKDSKALYASLIVVAAKLYKVVKD